MEETDQLWDDAQHWRVRSRDGDDDARGSQDVEHDGAVVAGCQRLQEDRLLQAPQDPRRHGHLVSLARRLRWVSTLHLSREVIRSIGMVVAGIYSPCIPHAGITSPSDPSLSCCQWRTCTRKLSGRGLSNTRKINWSGLTTRSHGSWGEQISREDT